MASLVPVVNLPSGGQPATDDNKIRVEFAVNINKHDDLAKIEKALKSKGVKLVSSDLGGKTIQLELGYGTNSNNGLGDVQTLQKFLETETGIVTVVKGLGDLRSAVADLEPPPSLLPRQQVRGVVRLSQLAGGYCFVDGAIDGFKFGGGNNDTRSRDYSLAIHEFGDLNGDTFQSIGEPIFDIDNQQLDHRQADSCTPVMSVRKIVPECDVSSLIGRSVAVIEHTLDPMNKRILSAGVIARASTIESNKKQICSCSGKTIWEERLDRQKSERD